jgi:hypothetical protein
MGDKLSEVASALAEVGVKLNDAATQIASGDIDLTEERAALGELISNAATALGSLSATLQAVSEALAGSQAAEAPAEEEPSGE